MMNFSQALKELWDGRRLQRRGWNGVGMHVALQQPDANSMNTLPYIYMITATHDRVPWVASHSDLLASDWDVLT